MPEGDPSRNANDKTIRDFGSVYRKNYAGSQIQFENGKQIAAPTIQGELEKALSTLIYGSRCAAGSEYNNRPIKAIFSGRTDKGVNALGQEVHFDTDETIVASKFLYSINEILPYDISVTNLREVDKSFHAQKSAKNGITDLNL